MYCWGYSRTRFGNHCLTGIEILPYERTNFNFFHLTGLLARKVIYITFNKYSSYLHTFLAPKQYKQTNRHFPQIKSLHTYLSSSRLQFGFSSKSENIPTPKSQSLLSLRSSFLSWQGFELRADVRKAQASFVIPQLESLQVKMNIC